ncbi:MULTISPECIES: hypothetical protein [Haloferax]|uniref:Uncharacterized protein n=1 Tax=Haloferax marinum TaxID=2666143 RepID=A0A6A8G5I9_9EURY|nr:MULTISPECIES: hypothetical protein [Haloferax]KAB1197382.1 hypothetical protein Hfx1150_07575 [Haloferax sp. CBA1150]MRW96424.1 hypothetical protein [Haloferax marinum]
MAVETFPQLAINLIYTILCLVPGFVTMKTAGYVGDAEFELDQFDKGTWSLIGSGASLSVLYFIYVGWVAMATGRLRLVVPVDLQWTELVAIYPVLLGVAVLIGYVTGRLLVRVRALPDELAGEVGEERVVE